MAEISRKDRVAELVKSGYTPSAAARVLEVPRSQVMQYLALLVGEGTLHRSHILLAMPQPARAAVDRCFEELGEPSAREILEANAAAPEPLETEDLVTYVELRDAVAADVYELIRRIELTLHGHIKRTLIREFGTDNEAWWREGIPANIRATCAATRETDTEPAAESFNYTTFIHLKEIFENQWNLLSGILPQELQQNRKMFRADMDRLNRIRNSVMHPVRMSRLEDDDYQFLEKLAATLRVEPRFEKAPPTLTADVEALPLP